MRMGKRREVCACALTAAFGLCLRLCCWSVPCSVKPLWNKNKKKSFAEIGKIFVSCLFVFLAFILNFRRVCPVNNSFHAFYCCMHTGADNAVSGICVVSLLANIDA